MSQRLAYGDQPPERAVHVFRTPSGESQGSVIQDRTCSQEALIEGGPVADDRFNRRTGLAQAEITQQLVAVFAVLPAAAQRPDLPFLGIDQDHGRLRLGDPFFVIDVSVGIIGRHFSVVVIDRLLQLFHIDIIGLWIKVGPVDHFLYLFLVLSIHGRVNFQAPVVDRLVGCFPGAVFRHIFKNIHQFVVDHVVDEVGMGVSNRGRLGKFHFFCHRLVVLLLGDKFEPLHVPQDQLHPFDRCFFIVKGIVICR